MRMVREERKPRPPHSRGTTMTHADNEMWRGWHAERRGYADDEHESPHWREGWRIARFTPPEEQAAARTRAALSPDFEAACGDPYCEGCAGAVAGRRLRRCALRTGIALALAVAAALIGRHVLQLDTTLPYVVAGILAERASWGLVR